MKAPNLPFDVLRRQVETIQKQAAHLEYTRSHLGHPEALERLDDPAVLERYEALTARFSRLQDLLIRPFKTIAVIELEEDKAERIPDLLNLMERRGILPDANIWREMRAVRNLIAHEYGDDMQKLGRLLDQVYGYSADLLSITEKTERYANKLISAAERTP